MKSPNMIRKLNTATKDLDHGLCYRGTKFSPLCHSDILIQGTYRPKFLPNTYPNSHAVIHQSESAHGQRLASNEP